MVTSIATLACNMKQQQLGLEIGAKLMKTAKDSMDVSAENLDKLLDQSAKAMELSVNPDLGSKVDVRG